MIFRSLLIYIFLFLAIPTALYSSENVYKDNLDLLIEKEFPSTDNFITDKAQIISESLETKINQVLNQIEKENGTELAIVTLNSLNGYQIKDFSTRLFNVWGIGKQDQNNGLLLLIALDDRQVSIDVGRGFEDKLTDIQSNNIINENIIPNFRQALYENGILSSTEQILKAIYRQDFKWANYFNDQDLQEAQIDQSGQNQKELNNNSAQQRFSISFFTLFYIFIFFFPFITSILASTKSWYAGGILGAIVGIILILILGVNYFSGAIITFIAVGLGLLFDYFLSKNYKGKNNSNGNDSDSFWGGGGFGGTGGGFGGSSGSFGGFGGGSSWGGGSSGRW